MVEGEIELRDFSKLTKEEKNVLWEKEGWDIEPGGKDKIVVALRHGNPVGWLAYFVEDGVLKLSGIKSYTVSRDPRKSAAFKLIQFAEEKALRENLEIVGLGSNKGIRKFYARFGVDCSLSPYAHKPNQSIDPRWNPKIKRHFL